MGDHSAIEWTDATWNPVAGCTRVSAGCDNCYAARLAATRMKHTRQQKGLATITRSGQAAFIGKIRLLPERLEQPMHWRRPRRIFVNSLSDLFHQDVPDEYIDRVFAVMACASQHTFQVLTKRPGRMQAYLSAPGLSARLDRRVMTQFDGWSPDALDLVRAMPLPNVWLGVSAEDQATAEERIPPLGQTPAAVRFVSAEPLLGAIDFGNAFDPAPDGSPYRPVNWVIVGGESGPGARPIDLGWVHSIVENCQFAGVPVFVKQLGAVPMMDEDVWHVEPLTKLLSARNRNRVPPGFVPLRFEDAKGGDWDEWPAELRVREMPASAGRPS